MQSKDDPSELLINPEPPSSSSLTQNDFRNMITATTRDTARKSSSKYQSRNQGQSKPNMTLEQIQAQIQEVIQTSTTHSDAPFHFHKHKRRHSSMEEALQKQEQPRSILGQKILHQLQASQAKQDKSTDRFIIGRSLFRFSFSLKAPTEIILRSGTTNTTMIQEQARMDFLLERLSTIMKAIRNKSHESVLSKPKQDTVVSIHHHDNVDDEEDIYANLDEYTFEHK